MSAGIAAGTWLMGGAVLGGAIIGAEATGDAAQAGVDAAGQAARLEHEQYLQTRQDLLPYRQVATGGGPEYQNLTNDMYGLAETWRQQVNSNTDPAVKRGMADAFGVADYNDITDEMFVESLLDPSKQNDHPYWNNLKQQYGPQLTSLERERSQFDPQGTGALQTLADYGRSKVLPGDYLPDTEIPQYQRSTIGDMPGIRSDIPQYDPNFDLTKDPSYQWRKSEQDAAINRNIAGMGKVTSGNRLEEIMKRSGEMASQEYKDAYGRHVQDYGIGRQNEAARYGRDVDAYGRAYTRDTDQYGRDLTAYNADVARESGMYGRGMSLFGLDYGAESDYLNRLAALSNIGQTATNTGAQIGATAASNQGNAIMAAGQAQGAGDIGRANAYAGALGDLTSLYAINKYGGSPYSNYGGMNTDVNNMYNYSGLF